MDRILAIGIEQSLTKLKSEAVYVKDGKAVFDTITARGVLCDNIGPIFETLLKTYCQGIPPGVKASIEKLRARLEAEVEKHGLTQARYDRANRCLAKLLTMGGVDPEKVAEIMLEVAKERD